MGKLVALYTSADVLLDRPHYIDALMDGIGLNHLHLGGTHRLSEETKALNPAPPGLAEHAPNVGGDDDTRLRQAIDAAHAKGLGVWLGGGGTHGAASSIPQWAGVTVDGVAFQDVPTQRYAREQHAVACCMGRDDLNRWLEATFADIAGSYDVEGFDPSHMRYAAPSFFDNLFGCACDACRGHAAEMGFDADGIVAAAVAFRRRLRSLRASDVRAATRLGLRLPDLLEWLDVGGANEGGVMDWFEFRARLIRDGQARCATAAREAAGPELAFGCDIFPPTFALLVGHRYRHFLEWSAFTSPLLSHVEVFVLGTLAAYAALLLDWIDGLSEEDALRFVYTLFGYEHLGLPRSLAELGVDEPDCELRCAALADIVETEMRRARLYNDGSIPSYPVIKGFQWPRDVIERLVAAADEIGHEGIVFQGTDVICPEAG